MKKVIYMIILVFGILEADFVKNSNIIYDKNTNLQWQYKIDSKKTWQSAIDYCENLVIDDYDDWRLPNKKELASIVDFTKYNPALDKAFDSISSEAFWTSTTYANELSWAWVINFYSGVESFSGKNGYQYVRCVRGETK